MTDPGPLVPAPGPPIPGPRAPSGLQLAGLGSRFAGRLIDSVVLTAAFYLGYVLYTSPGASAANRLTSRYLVILLFWFANDVALTAITGGSLGKLICGTRVVPATAHEAISFARVLLRWFVMVLLTIIPFGGLADALMIFHGETRQTIHDRLANTLVVRVR